MPHRAFAYYGQAYGLEFLAPIGTDADEEASAGRIAQLAKQARAGQIGALFTEHLTDRRAVQRIAAEAGMNVAGELYSDALSPPSGPAATYIDLMRGNTRIIAKSAGAYAAGLRVAVKGSKPLSANAAQASAARCGI